MTMTRQGMIHVLQALQHADDMMYHDIHEHGDGLYNEQDRMLAQMIDNTIAASAHMLDQLYPKASAIIQAEIDEALANAGTEDDPRPGWVKRTEEALNRDPAEPYRG